MAELERTGGSGLGRPRNLILKRMPEEQFRTLSRHLVPVDLPLGMQLSMPNAPIEHVYFPVSGLISTDALTDRGESVEVSVIGREGFSGLSGVLGYKQMTHTVVIQGSGIGLRIRAGVFREEFLKGGELARLVHQFIYLQMIQISQSVLCNRLHPVEARMARWMLTAADRMQNDVLELTQEFLAQMLGSRRSTVTVEAGRLQRQGLIGYTRGKVRIVDRPGLTEKACECYAIVRKAYLEQLGTDF